MNQYPGSFRSLVVWREAKKLVLQMYSITDSFPRHEMYRISDQLRRASSSVMANIAEGNERPTQKDRVHFFSIARSSLMETDCYLDLAHELQYLPDEIYRPLLDQINKTAYLLTKFITNLRK